MAHIKKLFIELYYEIVKISLLHGFADSIIFFMLSLNMTTLFDVKFYFALIAWIAFLAADVMYRVKHTTLNEIEEKNPEIKDILRTGRDNIEGNDFMILAMFEELILKMKKVSAGSILKQSNLLGKILVVCALSFSVIMLSANNIHIPDSVFDPNTYYRWFSSPEKENLDFYTVEFNESEGLFGDPELVDLGDDVLELKISPSINEISFGSVSEPEEKEFERGTFPDDVAAVSDASSDEKLPKESKIAIAYNLKLKENE